MKWLLKTCIPSGNRKGVPNAGELQTTSSLSDQSGAPRLFTAFLWLFDSTFA